MKSILIVDDKPEIAKIIMIYLSSSYQVVYMENPVKAISWMNEGNIPDGIISDLNMPEMSGEEFVCYSIIFLFWSYQAKKAVRQEYVY